LLQLAADPAARIEVMDSEGIDRVALFPTHSLRLGGVRQPQLAPALFRAYNDWLAEHCALNRERLLGIAMIPLQEPSLAVAEAERAVTKLDHRGLFISPHPVDKRNLDHPAYEPIWDLAEQLNVPALVHVSTGIRLPTAGAERFNRYCLFHLHAHPLEQMTAAASLILGGVLELHPRLRVGFMEAGCSWVPYWLERMDEHAENYRFEVPYLKERPSTYFRRQCFVSFELEERANAYVAESVGAETLVFASDFPHHDCFYPGAVEKVCRRKDLDTKLVSAMLSHNPRRLYFGD
jgi:predicted TIM-barrel fold metal-dependent hydrolase